jgi:hypothetical protein
MHNPVFYQIRQAVGHKVTEEEEEEEETWWF